MLVANYLQYEYLLPKTMREFMNGLFPSRAVEQEAQRW